MLSHTCKPHPRLGAWERASRRLGKLCPDRLYSVTLINVSADSLTGCAVHLQELAIEPELRYPQSSQALVVVGLVVDELGTPQQFMSCGPLVGGLTKKQSRRNAIEMTGLNREAFELYEKQRREKVDWTVQHHGHWTNVSFEKPRTTRLAKRSPQEDAQQRRRETDQETVFDRLTLISIAAIARKQDRRRN